MSRQRIGERRIELADLLRFAEASGDWNPIHTDSVAARRLMTGGVVAHGMSTLLWMLDEHLRANGQVPSSLTASFPRPLAIGDVAILERIEDQGGRQRLSVLQGGGEISSVLLDAAVGSRLSGSPPQALVVRGTPTSNSFDQLKQASGSLLAPGIDARDRADYPHVYASLGPSAIAGLRALSTLVGMYCPGLHSLIASVRLSFEPAAVGDHLEWKVARHSTPHAPLRIAFRGSGLDGHVDAFVRPGPVSQPAASAMRSAVAPGEFAEQTALVIGGSRGLGEVVAKLIGLGSGTVIVTYHEGRSDAERVSAEIREAGGRCSTQPFDAANAGRDINAILDSGVAPTHVYYFAAPRIGRSKSRIFSQPALEQFMQIFVEGFGHVAAALCARKQRARLFYPSTVFIDDLPAEQGEYIAAKAAGEALCRHLARHTALEIHHKRLPKLLTDQAAGLLSRGAGDTVPAMLDIVHAMNAIPTSPENA
jgi:hypothetical protein